jgi:hypothetical protein
MPFRFSPIGPVIVLWLALVWPHRRCVVVLLLNIQPVQHVERSELYLFRILCSPSIKQSAQTGMTTLPATCPHTSDNWMFSTVMSRHQETRVGAYEIAHSVVGNYISRSVCIRKCFLRKFFHCVMIMITVSNYYCKVDVCMWHCGSRLLKSVTTLTNIIPLGPPPPPTQNPLSSHHIRSPVNTSMEV